MDEPKCILCERSLFLEETVTVRSRGIATLIEFSKKYKDNIFKELVKRDSIVVHKRCRKRYYKTSVGHKAPGKRTRSLDSDQSFDFKRKCLICAEDASQEYVKKQTKRPMYLRDSVHCVETEPFKNSLITAAKQRNDSTVLDRLHLVSDLIAVEARYHKSCSKRFFARLSTSRPVGRPEVDDITNCIDYICNYLEGDENECQFTLPEILKDFKGPIPSIKTLKARLIKKYGDEIIVTDEKNKNQVICFRNTGYKILSQSWYESKKNDPQEERLRVIEAAAAIIREDIRSMVYPLDSYPKVDAFLEDAEKDVPQSLKLLMKKIITPKRSGNIVKINTKVTALSHAVISATRPNSFLSTIQIGLGALLYKKYGSKDLLDVLSSIGYCCSYYDARLFEASCMQHPMKNVLTESFSQFVFDNADVNIDTIDGSNTFHAMGGIQCITPHSSVRSETRISKLSKIPSARESAEFGSIPLVHFQKTENEGLKKIIIYDINERNPTETVNILPTDFLWMYGKWSERADIPGWNGFMENLTSNKPFHKSRVLCLPFLNFPPGQHDTIYSVLLSAVGKVADQKSCFVTFDQPLYYKARDIVASSGLGSPIGSVIVRLGGFHTLMSFMGAIGFIMSGSGLQDLFSMTYAAASTEKMLTGHAYSRAVRGHILAHLAIAKNVLAMMDISDDEDTYILGVLDNLGKPTVDTEAPAIRSVMKKFSNKLLELEQNSPTAQLWVQYFRMVTIMKRFIHAERVGDWNGHLQSVQQMLPFFNASGHFLYAKSCLLYLQDMADLNSKLTREDYDRFVVQGFFTIRRSEKFWSGIWSDMTIEQTLMRSIKTEGGVSRGRGITDSVLMKWISSMPAIMEVSLQIEQFCGVTFATTEQHVDARLSRIRRDDIDVMKFFDWFSAHNPFPVGGSIMSISTGVVGDEKINCHQAYEIGIQSMKNIIGNNFKDVKFQRKMRVTPLKCANSKVRIHDEDVPVSSDTIFRRISFFKKSDEDLKKYFEFELAPYPLSIFDDTGMRKTRKSVFYDLFDPFTSEDEELYCLDGPVYVIDGGFLLHRVVWQSKEKFSDILLRYVDYVKKYYGKPGTTIVFDGYPEDASMRSTKTAERLRRKCKLSAANVEFDQTMIATMSKEQLLSNDHNKQRLISMLREKLLREGFIVKVAVEDADRDIVTTAVGMAETSAYVAIVGEDTDLLILLTAIAPNCTNIVLMKPGKGSCDNNLYSPTKFKFSDAVKTNILFLHAFSGCDTTSAFFRQGKMKFVKTLEKNKHLQDVVTVFKSDCATPDEIDGVSQRFLEAVYGDKRSHTSLDIMRYEYFTKTIAKSTMNPASLPPTQAAAREHSLRTYHQVQMWLGRKKDPLQWGWKKTSQGLLPRTTTKEPAPTGVLQSVSCKCAKGCRGRCSCRKAGLKCSYICYECKGQSCSNTPEDEASTIINDPGLELLVEDVDDPEVHSTEEELEDGSKYTTEEPIPDTGHIEYGPSTSKCQKLY